MTLAKKNFLCIFLRRVKHLGSWSSWSFWLLTDFAAPGLTKDLGIVLESRRDPGLSPANKMTGPDDV
jgi:hypothetical protein